MNCWVTILGELSRYGCSVISVWNLIFKNIEQKVHGKLSFVRSSDFPKENKPSTLTTKSKRILYFIWRWKIPSWQFNIDYILPHSACVIACFSSTRFDMREKLWHFSTYINRLIEKDSEIVWFVKKKRAGICYLEAQIALWGSYFG